MPKIYIKLEPSVRVSFGFFLEGRIMGISSRISKISSVVAALCIVVYIAAIAFGAVGIIANVGERRSLAENEFFDLTDRATSSAVFLNFMSEAYQETIRDFLAASDTLLGIIISVPSGDFAFERYPGSGIVWAGASPRLKIGPGISEKYLPLRIEGQSYANVQAIYSYIDYDFFLRMLRNTLLAILAALAVAFITLLVELTQKNRGAYHRPADESGAVPCPKTADSGKTYDRIVVTRTKGEARPAARGQPDAERVAASEASEKRASPPKAPLPELSNPQGLFTPRGNVGWEAYTHDRLSSELHRCASLEQDLVFLLMEFRLPEKISDSLYRQFTDEAVSFFTMRDLIFEKGEAGISVIIPTSDLEHGMAKSEEFRSRIISRLSDSIESREDLCIGLSSRSGRLIDADRLMLESSTALEKALEDPVSPVVAFKSDPDKYREFIKSQTAKH
jgi:hypothetical protein